MPSFEWLQLSKKGKPQETPQNYRNSYIIFDLFQKKGCMISASGKWRDDFRMGIVLCESDFCKMAKMRVGSYLGPVLQILMDNLHLCVSKRSQQVNSWIYKFGMLYFLGVII